MKANEVPERIYYTPRECGGYLTTTKPEPPFAEGVEYTRTDAFIEKACEYIKEHLFDYWSQSVTNESKFIDEFRKYMEGE